MVHTCSLKNLIDSLIYKTLEDVIKVMLLKLNIDKHLEYDLMLTGPYFWSLNWLLQCLEQLSPYEILFSPHMSLIDVSYGCSFHHHMSLGKKLYIQFTMAFAG